MAKIKTTKRSQPRTTLHLIYAVLALAIGLSSLSCTNISAKRVQSVQVELEEFAKELGTAVREQAGTPAATQDPASVARNGNSSEPFAACPQFFANATPPVVAHHAADRALCYDAFAILHSGQSKTPVYVAERLNKASVADAHEKRTNKFFPDARLRSAERATLDDYKGSGFDRGHMAPAGDMPTSQAMAQSFSLANMVPQASEHNRGTWAKTVEAATRKYAARATGDVYVITGPVFEPSIAQSPSIGSGHVHVPKYLFKLVYDQSKNRAWAHWQLNDDATRGSRPISYAELVKRTGIDFLPGVTPSQ